jgi:hypothetical protein
MNCTGTFMSVRAIVCAHNSAYANKSESGSAYNLLNTATAKGTCVCLILICQVYMHYMNQTNGPSLLISAVIQADS